MGCGHGRARVCFLHRRGAEPLAHSDDVPADAVGGALAMIGR